MVSAIGRGLILAIYYVRSKIKDPKHPLHYLLYLVKVSRSQMVLRPICFTCVLFNLSFHFNRCGCIWNTIILSYSYL